MSGGFIGVDIFFVISGFLITSIIAREMDIERFSLAQFYKRRIIRILPALSLVLLVVSAISTIVLFPSDLKYFGNSLTWTALFSSNFYFAWTTGYFRGAADYQVLLHMWSLAVEEQFYILFPILLPLLIKYLPRQKLAAIAILCAGSFAISLVGIRWYSEIIFYLLPGRAWEIGLGALLALHGGWNVSPILRNMLATLGIALVATGLFMLTPQSSFPSYNALLLCLGAALLIAFASGTFIGGVLGGRLFVAIGIISYSLYLWHWPVIVLTKIWWGPDDSWTRLCTMISVSILLAIMTTHLLEKPLSRKLRDKSARAVIIAGAGILAILTILGVVISQTAYLKSYPASTERLLRYQRYFGTAEQHAQFLEGSCFATQPKSLVMLYGPTCRSIMPGRENYLLLGDSHAAQYAMALRKKLLGSHISQVTVATCRPIIGVKGASCKIIDETLRNLIAHRDATKIILAARWDLADIPSLTQTIKMLRARGYDVTIFGPGPEYASDLPGLLARSLQNGNPALPDRARVTDRQNIDRRLRSAISDARYVSVYDRICPSERCRTLATQGVPMLFDTNHLTPAGAQFVLDGINLD